MRRACLILLAGLYWSLGCAAVKFDLPAVTPDHIEQSKRCLSQYVPKETLVFARVNVGPGYNQRVDIEVKKSFSLFIRDDDDEEDKPEYNLYNRICIQQNLIIIYQHIYIIDCG